MEPKLPKLPKVLNVLSITDEETRLDTAAFNSVLDKVGTKPFVIYSISGATRSGKSYLLNHFIKYFEARGQKQKRRHKQKQKSNLEKENYDNWINFPLSHQFAWRSGKERETTGINLWSEPYFVETDNGRVAVLLMDTQGLFDDKTTARQNAIILALTALCSSVTIFNVMRQVNEDLLQQLQYFSNYAKSLSSQVEIKSPFQKLLLLVRDFEIPGYAHGLHGRTEEPHGNGSEKSKNFMRETFHLDGQPENCPEENTIVRQEILECFEDVSVYLLPDPGKEFTNKGGVPDDDFQEEVKAFIEDMLCGQHLLTKSIDGLHYCTGIEFKSFISSWAKLIEKSDETFPEVFTMAENAAFMNYTIAKEMALKWFYQNSLQAHAQNEMVLKTKVEWEREKESYRIEVLRIFGRMKKFQVARFDEEFQKQIEDTMESHLENFAPVMFAEEEIEVVTDSEEEVPTAEGISVIKSISKFTGSLLSSIWNWNKAILKFSGRNIGKIVFLGLMFNVCACCGITSLVRRCMRVFGQVLSIQKGITLFAFNLFRSAVHYVFSKLG